MPIWECVKAGFAVQGRGTSAKRTGDRFLASMKHFVGVVRQWMTLPGRRAAQAASGHERPVHENELKIRKDIVMRRPIHLCAKLVFAFAAVAVLERGAAAAPAFVWPLTGTTTPHKINSPFGPRLRASAGYVYEFHPGLDFAADLGTPVYAAAGGTVRLLTDDAGCTITAANATANPCASQPYPDGGRIVQLDHGNKLYTNYLHLSQQVAGLVTGGAVTTGQLIGYTGATGQTDFPHLHFEVRDGSYYSTSVKNPLGYLPWSGDQPTAIASAAIIQVAGAPVVTASLQAVPDDLNLDQVTVTVYDVHGVQVAQSGAWSVGFNAKQNCGGATNPLNGITLLPAAFNRTTALYALTVKFSGLTLPSGGTFVVTATDVSGLTSAVTQPIP
jgi:hypothetical protein